jgi:hypothetical protein
MAYVSVLCFTKAESEEAAIRNVEVFCEEHSGKEFYDDWAAGKCALPLERVADGYLNHALILSGNVLQSCREEAEAARKDGNKQAEAYAMRRASDILFENLCSDMPYFNIDEYGYSLPDKDNRAGWWSVGVDFHV